VVQAFFLAVRVEESQVRQLVHRALPPASWWFVAVVVFAVFARVLTFGFVNLDDDYLVYSGPVADGVAWGDVVDALNPFADRTSFGSEYLPLRDLSYMVDSIFWGANPVGFHLSNLLLHLLNTLCVFAITRRFFGIRLAPFGALLFGVHPLAVESVAWISSRKDLLAAFFVMLGILVRTAHPRSRSAGWACVVCLCLGLLSKYAAVGLVLFMFFWCVLKRKERGPVIFFPPWLWVMSCLSGVAIWNATRIAAIEGIIKQTPDVPHLALALGTMGLHLKRMIFPWPLEVTHHILLQDIAGYTVGILLGCGLVAMTVFCVIRVRMSVDSRVWIGPVWVVCALVPVANLFGQPWLYAERYAYLALGGFSIFISGCAWIVLNRMGLAAWRRRFFVLELGVLVCCAWTACVRVPAWKNSISLWTRESVRSSMDLAYLGRALAEEGRFVASIERLEEAVTLQPANGEAWMFLAHAYFGCAREAEALLAWQRAAMCLPEDWDVQYNLGLALWYAGRKEEGIRIWRGILNHAPDHQNTRKTLSWAKDQ